jgi:hypothetical protein
MPAQIRLWATTANTRTRSMCWSKHLHEKVAALHLDTLGV